MAAVPCSSRCRVVCAIQEKVVSFRDRAFWPRQVSPWSPTLPSHCTQVFFDLTLDGEPEGRIVVEVFPDVGLGATPLLVCVPLGVASFSVE